MRHFLPLALAPPTLAPRVMPAAARTVQQAVAGHATRPRPAHTRRGPRRARSNNYWSATTNAGNPNNAWNANFNNGNVNNNNKTNSNYVRAVRGGL